MVRITYYTLGCLFGEKERPRDFVFILSTIGILTEVGKAFYQISLVQEVLLQAIQILGDKVRQICIAQEYSVS